MAFLQLLIRLSHNIDWRDKGLTCEERLREVNRVQETPIVVQDLGQVIGIPGHFDPGTNLAQLVESEAAFPWGEETMLRGCKDLQRLVELASALLTIGLRVPAHHHEDSRER